MISDNIIKQSFIVQKLKTATELIYKTQGSAARGRLHKKTGNTFTALESPKFNINYSGLQFQVVSNITKQLRFQDFGVRKIYTKPLFEALKKARREIKYGFTDEVHDVIRKELENTVNPK